MTTILITGVAGLIGSNFAKYLSDKGFDVIGIDDLSGGYAEFVPPGIFFKKLDLNDAVALDDFFSKRKIDYVYHFAAYAAEGLSPFIRNFNYRNNVIASINVINNCIRHNVKKIIFTSSMAVYGHTQPPFDEFDIPVPADPYGVAKYTVEMDLGLANEQFGLDCAILRPHNVVGINQNIWDRYRNVIGIWIRQALSDQPITIYGDGLQTRAFSDVHYLMSPMEKLMCSTDEIGGSVFNIGADKPYSILTVAEIVRDIAKKHGYHTFIKHLEARNEVKHAYCVHAEAKEKLGFSDDTNLEKLIDKMFSWAKNQPMRKIKDMEYEVYKGMYSFWKK